MSTQHSPSAVCGRPILRHHHRMLLRPHAAQRVDQGLHTGLRYPYTWCATALSPHFLLTGTKHLIFCHWLVGCNEAKYQITPLVHLPTSTTPLKALEVFPVSAPQQRNDSMSCGSFLAAPTITGKGSTNPPGFFAREEHYILHTIVVPSHARTPAISTCV